MKNINLFLALLTTASLLISCNKSNSEATGAGDAVIVAKKSGSETVYGISLYAYTYSSFSSVKVVSSAIADQTYTLKANQGFKTNYYYETPESGFSPTKPEPATYSFSAVFDNGATDEFTDVLTDKVLPLPNIESCVYNPTAHQLDVKWTTLTDADSYAINILDGTKVVFASIELAKTLKAYSISTSGGGWATDFTPVAGRPYTVRLLAFLYETEPDPLNVQASSFSDQSVVWGE